MDEIDRCLPGQALTVLESMKLFFDMPGFVFVVGLDERVVKSAVRTKFEQQPDSAGRELELWPGIGVLPLELSQFLRSPEAEALAESSDLGGYVSLLETTSTTQSWIKDAMRDVGHLRRHIRGVRPPLRFGSTSARDIAEQIKDILGRLATYQSGAGAAGPEYPLEKLRSLVKVLAPSMTGETQPEETKPEQLDHWREDAAAQTDALQEQLRLIRRSSAFAAA
jgi:hypothetical protein